MQSSTEKVGEVIDTTLTIENIESLVNEIVGLIDLYRSKSLSSANKEFLSQTLDSLIEALRLPLEQIDKNIRYKIDDLNGKNHIDIDTTEENQNTSDLDNYNNTNSSEQPNNSQQMSDAMNIFAKDLFSNFENINLGKKNKFSRVKGKKKGAFNFNFEEESAKEEKELLKEEKEIPPPVSYSQPPLSVETSSLNDLFFNDPGPTSSLPEDAFSADDLLKSLETPEVEASNVEEFDWESAANGFGQTNINTEDALKSLDFPSFEGVDQLSFPEEPKDQGNQKVVNNQAEYNLLRLFGNIEGIQNHTGGELFREYGVKDDINRKHRPGTALSLGKNRNRKQMEDTNIVVSPFGDKDHALFCVFDGHAGKEAAEKAKKILPDMFWEIIEREEEQQSLDYRELFNELYQEVDKQLDYEVQGSTATTLILWRLGEERFLQVANLGDSTAFLCRDGQAIFLSHDHKVTDPEETERLLAGGYIAHAGVGRVNGLAISRAFGDQFMKLNDLGVIGTPFVSDAIQVTEQDSLLIVASDGLWDAMSGQEAFDLIKDLNSAEEMAQLLVSTAKESPKCSDNITVIVVIL